MNTEPSIWPTQQRAYTEYSTHHTHCCRTNFFQTALRNTFAGYHVNTQLSGRARARRWTALAIQTDYSTPAAGRQHWAAAPILIVKRSRLQLFLSIRFCGATALTEKNCDDSFEMRMESGGLHAHLRSSKESSRFFSVEAVALPNLP